MVGAQALAVTLADFSQDVDPVPCLYAVVGLNVQRPFGLDHLKHLESEQKGQRVVLSVEQTLFYFSNG